MSSRQRLATAVAAVLVAVGTTVAISAQPADAARKPARQMTTTLHHHPLQLRVKVEAYPNAPTYLQKKTCGTCDWAIVDHHRTNAAARVRYRLHAPRTGSWFYRVMTPERPRFRESYSRVAKTFLH